MAKMPELFNESKGMFPHIVPNKMSEETFNSTENCNAFSHEKPVAKGTETISASFIWPAQLTSEKCVKFSKTEI